MRYLTDERDVRERLQPVIVGCDSSAYSYIRCFQEAYGLTPIELSSLDMRAVSTSSFVDYRVVEGLDGEDVFATALVEVGAEVVAKGRVGLVIGCGDHYVRLIARHRSELEDWAFVPYCPLDLMEVLQRKDRFYGLCDELGIAYPRTAYLACAAGATFDLPDDLRFPVVAKPSHWPSYQPVQFEGKRKIFFLDTREELEAVWRSLSATAYDEELVVQEFVPGDDTAMRIVSAFVGAEGELVFLQAGHVLLEDHAPFAIGNPAVIVPSDEEGLIDGTRRILEATDYRGMANFDVKVDPRDGSFRFFEINTRSGGSSDFVRQAGINFARAIVEAFVLGHRQEPEPRTRDYCYSIVSKRTALHFIRDRAARDTVRRAFQEGLAASPLAWDEDNPAQRKEARRELAHLAVRFVRFH